MKPWLIVLCCLVLGTAPAHAQSAAGTVGVFSDVDGMYCDFVDAGAVVTVYFFHVNHSGAAGSGWRLDIGNLPWVHLQDDWPWLIIPPGPSTEGVWLGYASCATAPTPIGSATFFGSNAPACSIIRIVAHPEAVSGHVEGADCSDPPVTTYPAGGTGVVNPDGTCPCSPPVPAKQSTWGAVKGLYR